MAVLHGAAREAARGSITRERTLNLCARSHAPLARPLMRFAGPGILSLIADRATGGVTARGRGERAPDARFPLSSRPLTIPWAPVVQAWPGWRFGASSQKGRVEMAHGRLGRPRGTLSAGDPRRPGRLPRVAGSSSVAAGGAPACP